MKLKLKKNDNSFQIILPIESILDDNYLINADGVLEYKNRRCSHCTSKNTHKKGYTWTTIYLEKGIPLRVKVKRYYCRHCFKWSQTEFIWIFMINTLDYHLNLKKIIRKYSWKFMGIA